TKKEGKGTGIGLSLCHEIIQKHKGNIYLDKDYGKGAKFIIKLPIVELNEDKYLKAETLNLPKEARVLIIDDEPDVLMLQKNVLKMKNFVVDTADNCKEGLDLIDMNGGNYDVIISDLKMPGKMNGRDLYNRVKQKDRKLARRFIFVTGDISENTRNFLNKNDILYIRKPFKIKDFLCAVSTGIRRKNDNLKLPCI
ncbi:response regulator, partial [candidate division KSB1 bacterium]